MAELDTSIDLNEVAIDFKAVKRRFIQLNDERLQSTRAALRDRQQELLDLLPLLFHVNHPLLPGYASKFAPCGVWGYEPERKILNLAKSLARSFSYKKPTKKQWPILALYFMGSSGTIAHSEGSDLDIWLCYDPAMKAEQVEKLQQKAQGIEKWAESLGLEIHFFLINPQAFRRGGSSELSSESSGSAQHSLLLDEFYRTSVLLQGQYPLWWLVPPQYEAAYDLYVEEMARKRFLYARDTIDFGGLSHIPAEEFFGAALWQLSKGIDAPYKSILKLLLIESYAREYPAVELLSKRFKQSVYDGVSDPQLLDPYMLMLQKVSDYLQRQDERQRLALAHRCFYFKADIRLSEKATGRRSDGSRRELLQELTKSWGWSQADLMLMDARKQWRVHRVLEERQILFQALVSSYRALSDFARKYSGLSLISQEDLTTLGRKLYTAFERKAGKIDIITRGIDAELGEPQLTVVELVSDEGEGGWQVYNGVVTFEQLRMETPIKRTRSLTELLAWCHLNGVTTNNSTYMVHSGHSNHSSREVESLAQRIAQQFPESMLQSESMEVYARAAKLIRSEFYVNTGVRLSDKMTMTRNLAAIGHTDPFYFGHDGDNLVLAIDQLSLNSWREAITYRFRGESAVMEALCNYLKWYPRGGEAPPVPSFYGGGSALGGAIARRLEQLFRQVFELFYTEQGQGGEHYLLSVGGAHYSLYFEGDTPRYERFAGLGELFNRLARPREGFLSLHFDKQALQESFLPTIYEHNSPGIIQLFFYPQGRGVELFVLDEKGSLFHQHAPFFDEKTLINQFSRFFEAVSNRINFLLQEGMEQGTIEGLEFYRLSKDTLNRKRATAVAPEFYQPGKTYFSLQVIVEQNGEGESVFTLYCDGKEFSTLEHGRELFNRVVEHVLVLRNSGQRYPIYITDISLDRSVLGEENVGKMQANYFLNYKRRIEEQLNRSMQAQA